MGGYGTSQTKGGGTKEFVGDHKIPLLFFGGITKLNTYLIGVSQHFGGKISPIV